MGNEISKSRLSMSKKKGVFAFVFRDLLLGWGGWVHFVLPHYLNDASDSALGNFSFINGAISIACVIVH